MSRPSTNLRSRREAAGLSREALAALAGVSTSTIVRTELGYHDPSLPSLRRLANALGVTVAELFDDEPNGDEAVA